MASKYLFVLFLPYLTNGNLLDYLPKILNQIAQNNFQFSVDENAQCNYLILGHVSANMSNVFGQQNTISVLGT